MTINTINTKQEQLKNGLFTTGVGEQVILIVGSCRSVPYVQYLHDLFFDRFTVHFLDPFNWNYDLNDNRIDMEAKINSLQVDNNMLRMLKSVDIVIHEWYANYGMFSFDTESEKNIYQYGLNPKTDVCIPAFNDKFILVADIVNFDADIRRKVLADYNVTGKLSDLTLAEIDAVKLRNLCKFMEVCEKSSFPDFKDWFKQNYRTTRLWHNSNHVTKAFTGTMFFNIMDELRIGGTQELMDYLDQSTDLYANIFTPLTEYDGMDWNEPVKPLRELL